jgi:hypothetical protein
MEQAHNWEAGSLLVVEDFFAFYGTVTEVPLLCLQEPATGQQSKLDWLSLQYQILFL